MEDDIIFQLVRIFNYGFYPVTIVGLLLVEFVHASFKEQLPEWFKRMLFPGKLVDTKHFAVDVPKRWFLHFYVYAAILNLFVAGSVVLVYVFRLPAPGWLITTLDLLMGSERKSTVREISVIVAAGINLIQSFHRIYECLFISIFSNAKMNVLHYLLGFIFYSSLPIALLTHAPGFASKDTAVKALSFSSLQWYHIAGFGLALWAIWQQTKANMILANLRKNDRGKVVNMRYAVPRGGWFEMVSCPHYLAEMILYGALVLTLEMTHLLYWVLFCFVVVNQGLMSIETHKWYKQKFREYYPKNRKAFIPYIL